jgi:hypothetical protein
MTRERAKSCGQNWAVAANWWQSATFCGFAARHWLRKTVSMEALEEHARVIARASVEIRTPVQSLAAHSRATGRTRDTSLNMKSVAAERT